MALSRKLGHITLKTRSVARWAILRWKAGVRGIIKEFPIIGQAAQGK